MTAVWGQVLRATMMALAPALAAVLTHLAAATVLVIAVFAAVIALPAGCVVALGLAAAALFRKPRRSPG